MSEMIAILIGLGCLGIIYYYLEKDSEEKSKLEQLRQKLIDRHYR